MTPRTKLSLALFGSLLTLAGCAMTSQLHSELNFDGAGLDESTLLEFGVGVLTPSVPTGKESDKQALGDALGRALEARLPEGNVMALSDMLSAINRAGHSRAYSDMLSEYEHTGILDRDRLSTIANAGDVRYLAKFNLGDFSQGSDRRLAIAGIRLFETWRAAIRVHLEIWDSETGEISWQGNEELVFAREGIKERPVSFSQVAALAAQHLLDRVGESGRLTSEDPAPALAALD